MISANAVHHKILIFIVILQVSIHSSDLKTKVLSFLFVFPHQAVMEDEIHLTYGPTQTTQNSHRPNLRFNFGLLWMLLYFA